MMNRLTFLILIILVLYLAVDPYVASSLTPLEAGRLAESLAKQRRTTTTVTNRLPSGLVAVDTLLAHAGIDVLSSSLNNNNNAPMAPPLYTATTYTRGADGEYQINDYEYTRMGNPTRNLLEREIGRLDVASSIATTTTTTAEDQVLPPNQEEVTCCAFASGMMAASSIVLAHRTPLHVLMPFNLYHGVSSVLLDVFSRFGVLARHVDMNDPNQVAEAVTLIPPHDDLMVWLETPSNPLCQVLDIQAIADSTRNIRSDATIVVDSTLAPPVITQPLMYGADVVLHSATKYLAGHSDALIGVVTTSPFTERGIAVGKQLRMVQMTVGGVASPWDCWLTLRGLRTLHLRVARQSRTAEKLARFLQSHEDVKAVYYPGLEDHPSHAIARRQMKAFGGVLSVEVADEVSAFALAGALKTIQRATSLGGTETLIEHRASIEPKGRVTSPPGLLRLSVGLEDPDDLLADLASALAIMKQVCSTVVA